MVYPEKLSIFVMSDSNELLLLLLLLLLLSLSLSLSLSPLSSPHLLCVLLNKSKIMDLPRNCSVVNVFWCKSRIMDLPRNCSVVNVSWRKSRITDLPRNCSVVNVFWCKYQNWRRVKKIERIKSQSMALPNFHPFSVHSDEQSSGVQWRK